MSGTVVDSVVTERRESGTADCTGVGDRQICRQWLGWFVFDQHPDDGVAFRARQFAAATVGEALHLRQFDPPRSLGIGWHRDLGLHFLVSCPARTLFQEVQDLAQLK